MAYAATIEVEGIRKSFGPTVALAGVDLLAEEGRVLALLGPNGAGKTTLVRILTTLLRPDAGRARVAGYDVVTEATPLRSVIGLAGQFAAVDELLTGRENLELVGRLYHLSKAERAARAQMVLERFALTGAADRIVKGYSGGMRRRLDLGASLVGRPRVLILDEPTTGLDPRTRNDVWRYIEDLVEEGTTVLLTTQYLEEADYLAHRVVVVDEGRVIAEGTSDELKDQMGGDVLEVRVADAADLGRAGEVIAAFGDGHAQIDADQLRVSIPTRAGPGGLIEAGRRLTELGIALSDLGIRRPSLDDVFLSLTGHGAEAPDRAAARRAGAGRRPPDQKEFLVTAIATDRDGRPRTAPMTPALALSDTIGIAQRDLKRIMRTPQLLFFSAVQPVMFVLLFRYVFGGSIRTPGTSYVNYLMPGIFVQVVLFGGAQTAVGLATDLKEGVIDRFRTLPMARSAVLAGRTLADLLRNVFTVLLMVGVGLLVGFRFHGSPAANVGALRARPGLRVCLLVGLRGGRAGGAGSGDRSGRGLYPAVPAGVRQFRVRAGGQHAGMAAGLREPPAGQRDGDVGPGPPVGPAGRPLAVASGALVAGHFFGLRDHRRAGVCPVGVVVAPGASFGVAPVSALGPLANGPISS